MGLSKAGVLQYEDMPLKKDKLGRSAVLKELEKMNTETIIWHLVKRHKFGLVILAFLAENGWMLYHFVRYGVN